MSEIAKKKRECVEGLEKLDDTINKLFTKDETSFEVFNELYLKKIELKRKHEFLNKLGKAMEFYGK